MCRWPDRSCSRLPPGEWTPADRPGNRSDRRSSTVPGTPSIDATTADALHSYDRKYRLFRWTVAPIYPLEYVNGGNRRPPDAVTTTVSARPASYGLLKPPEVGGVAVAGRARIDGCGFGSVVGATRRRSDLPKTCDNIRVGRFDVNNVLKTLSVDRIINRTSVMRTCTHRRLRIVHPTAEPSGESRRGGR